MKKYKAIFALILFLISFGVAWYYYGWQMPCILFIILWAQNIESSLRK